MGERELLHQTMCQDAYWQVNKSIARAIGGKSGRDAALLLADLLSKERMYAMKGELREDDYFYNSQETIERDTTLSPYEQQKTLRVLEHHRFITTKIAKAGSMGATIKHFKIHHSQITKILSSGNEKILIPEVKKFEINNNIVNKNEISKIVSKETISGSDEPSVGMIRKTKIQPIDQPSKYVEYWNSQECTPKHRPSSDGYKRAHGMCLKLKSGTFGKYHKLGEEWREQYQIPIELSRKKFTDDEIMEGIRRMALHFRADYWPIDKKKGIPTSMDAMMYHAFSPSKSSWFLKVMAQEPKPIADQAKSSDPAVLALYKKLFRGKTLSDQEEVKLIRMVNLLISKQREIAEHMEPYLGHTSFSGKFGSRNNRFYQTHIEWLTGWCDDIRVETVWKTWGAFVRWARDYHQMEIDPNNDNVRHAKQAHKRAEAERAKIAERSERGRLQQLVGLV